MPGVMNRVWPWATCSSNIASSECSIERSHDWRAVDYRDAAANKCRNAAVTVVAMAAIGGADGVACQTR